ncbi:acyltransferase family protein [Sphingomonas sp. FW199]|uniref:acyltransferase family protein n=1 Tax=Sphingomonas sp. FW199 TaxID=3400217 RepID=UPI003CF243FA
MKDGGAGAARQARVTDPVARHHGMDWLRIGAFAILILYHIGMVYVPWGFHVKSPSGADWTTIPMLAVNAWRLGLLFVVSGYASRALLERSSGIASFTGNRTLRLVLPLLFGVIVIVPPQPWVELVTKFGYPQSYWHFWTTDYFRFGKLFGLVLPTWNHLWFIVYLWVYTLLLALIVLLPGGGRAQRLFDRAMSIGGGMGVVLIPLGWLLCVHVLWFPFRGETHALFDDYIAHLMYLPGFLFGFALARSGQAMAAIRRWWPVTAAVAALAYGFKVYAELAWPGDMPVPNAFIAPYAAAHATQQWCAIVAMIGIAERFWNRDHPIRPMLTEAVFPFYLIHQTIIILAIFWLVPLALPGWAEFLATVAVTVAGCWLFYGVGRTLPWLRPLIGLRRKRPHLPMPRPVAAV